MHLANAVVKVVLLAGVALVTLAPPAAAHTGFESSRPANGDLADAPVDIVTLVFTGEAEPTGDGFLVLDGDGQVRVPTATTGDGLTWQLQFDPPLAPGDIGVRWTVKAPDAHPIQGAFSFTVEDPPSAASVDPPTNAASPTPAGGATTTAVTTLDEFLDTGSRTGGATLLAAVGRMLSISGALVGIGGLAFAGLVLRGEPRDVRYVLFWVRRTGLVVLVGAVIELFGQVAIESAGDWFSVVDAGAVGDTVNGGFGLAVALRAVGGLLMTSGARISIAVAATAPDPVVALRQLVGANVTSSSIRGPGRVHTPPAGGPGAWSTLSRPADAMWYPTSSSTGAFVGVAALLASYAFDGHTASKGSWPLALLDVVHVAAAAVWVGGVTMMAAVLWYRRRGGRPVRAALLALRFSVVATGSLALVGVAGLAMAVIILDSPQELISTTWGRVLLLKSGLVAIAAGAGGFNHKVLVPQLQRRPDDPALAARFRNVLAGEAVVLMATGLVTGWLVGAAS